MTHPTPKDPEVSVSKSGCCVNCDFNCGQTENAHIQNGCPGHKCHLPPAAEEKYCEADGNTYPKYGKNRQLRCENCKRFWFMSENTPICKPVEMHSVMPVVEESPVLNTDCECSRCLTEESGESWAIKWGEELEELVNDFRADRIMDSVHFHNFVRETLSQARSQWNADLVKELEEKMKEHCDQKDCAQGQCMNRMIKRQICKEIIAKLQEK